MKIGNSLLYSSLIVACYGVIEIFMGHNIFGQFLDKSNLTEFQVANLESKIRGGVHRIQSSFLNPLVLGQFIVLMLPVLLFFRTKTKSNITRYNIVITLLFFLLFFVRSRASTVILVLGLVYLVYYFIIISKSRIEIKLITLLFLFILIPSLIYLNSDNGFIIDFFDGKDLTIDSNRETQLLLAVPIILNNLWTGCGFGLGATVLDFGSLNRANGTIDNYFLTVILDSGILALVSFIILYLKIIFYYFKVNKENLFLLIGLILFMINMFSLSLTEIHPLFYFLLSFLLISETKDKRQFNYNNKKC